METLLSTDRGQCCLTFSALVGTEPIDWCNTGLHPLRATVDSKIIRALVLILLIFPWFDWQFPSFHACYTVGSKIIRALEIIRVKKLKLMHFYEINICQIMIFSRYTAY